MRLYVVSGGTNDPTYVGTKDDLWKVAAEESSEAPGIDLELRELETVDFDKAAILRLLNAEGGFVVSEKPLGRFRGGKFVRGSGPKE